MVDVDTRIISQWTERIKELEKHNRDMRDVLVEIEIIGRGTGSNSKACRMGNIARQALAQVKEE